VRSCAGGSHSSGHRARKRPTLTEPLKPHEIRTLLRLKRPEWDPRQSGLAGCHSVLDLRAKAEQRLPRAIFDYVDGGADDEQSLARNEAAFKEWEFVPLNLHDVANVDPSTVLLGTRIALPLALAPTGYTRLMHPAGETAVATAAMHAGLPYTLSTVGTTSIEELARTGHPNVWYQLYVWRDRGLTRNLVTRAWEAGYRVLEVTVDTPVSGYRIRDVRNGLTIPPQLTLRTLAGIAAKPSYWVNMLRGPAITLANAHPTLDGEPGLTIENLSAQFDPTVTWEDIEQLREQWPGHLILKGTVGPDDARRADSIGLDGIHLSNHGGRQLDRLVAPIDILPLVRDAVGDNLTILVDSGIRHGADLATAIALGADAGAIGRAYLYGLMVAGEAGVELALKLLRTQFTRTMQLLGVASINELRANGHRLLMRRSSVSEGRARDADAL
jgi:L-lactate dehydrogenase (cytochrome)